MCGQFDDAYNEWEEDPEGPQACDLTDEDEDETPTVPCPACGELVPDFVDRCPYCGQWIMPLEHASRTRSPLFIAVVLIALASFVYLLLR
jgi:hypothetical protein